MSTVTETGASSVVQTPAGIQQPEGTFKDKAVKAISSFATSVVAIPGQVKATVAKVQAVETTAIDGTIDNGTRKVQNKLLNTAIDLATKSKNLVDTKIDFFNNDERRFFEKVGSETHTVIKYVNDYKNAAAKLGDTASRGAARGTRILARSILRPILSLGFTFRPGEVLAEGIAAALTAVVRAVGTVVTAFFTYLPELLIVGSIVTGLVFLGLASPIAGGVVAASLALLTAAVVYKQISDSKKEEQATGQPGQAPAKAEGTAPSKTPAQAEASAATPGQVVPAATSEQAKETAPATSSSARAKAEAEARAASTSAQPKTKTATARHSHVESTQELCAACRAKLCANCGEVIKVLEKNQK